jgi:hypothetical protein
MTSSLRTAAAAAVLVAALAAPAASLAATTSSTPPQHFDLQTRMVDTYRAGEFDGTLALTIYPSGIVQGTYRPTDGGFRTVTGGLDGRNIWLEIGMNGRVRVIGTFEHGVLHSVVQIPGPNTVTFDATPNAR